MIEEAAMRFPSPARSPLRVRVGTEVFRKHGKFVSRPLYVFTTRAMIPTFARGLRSRDITLLPEESASIESPAPSTEVEA